MSFPLFGLKKQKLWGFFGFLGGGDDFASKAPSGRIPEQGRAKRGPRAAKSDPKVRPGCQESRREAPKKAQGRPRIRLKRTQEQRSQGKKIQVEIKQQKRRPEARRALSPEPLARSKSANGAH